MMRWLIGMGRWLASIGANDLTTESEFIDELRRGQCSSLEAQIQLGRFTSDCYVVFESRSIRNELIRYYVYVGKTTPEDIEPCLREAFKAKSDGLQRMKRALPGIYISPTMLGFGSRSA